MRQTEKPTALLIWMVAGPEVSRVVDAINKPCLVSDTRHHEYNPEAQATFFRHVKHSPVSSISEMGNPCTQVDICSFWTAEWFLTVQSLNPSKR